MVARRFLASSIRKDAGHAGSSPKVHDPGMTLRDYFAAAHMNGALSVQGSHNIPADAAKFAYAMADAMLLERAR